MSALLEIVFPSLCLLCGGPVLFDAVGDEPVCRTCLKRLRPIGGRRCGTCGRPLIAERDTCTSCRERTYSFQTHLSLFEYHGAIRELIYQYKFRDRRRLAGLFARLLAERCLELFPGHPVVPVPARRSASRGGRHVERLARRLEQAHGIRVQRVLVRSGRTPQKMLGFEARRENIRGAVSISGHLPRDLAGGLVLLDDIFTTGATADECTRALRQAGSGPVHVLTLAMD